MSDENYIDAMEELVSQSKASIAIGGAPLALLLAQLRHLTAIEGLWSSCLLTIASLSLGVATFGAWFIGVSAQNVLAVEKWRKGGVTPQKGKQYFEFLKELNPNAEAMYSEEGFIAISRKWAKPTVACLLVGYLSLILLLLTFIWSSPQ